MKLKHSLMATTAASLLMAGGIAQNSAMAQQDAPKNTQQNAPGNRDNGTSTMPAPDAPGSARGGLTASNGAGADPNSSTLHEIKDAKVQIGTLNGVSVKDLNDMAIYSSDGEKIGEIDRVLGDSSNTPKAVAVDAGGFLGTDKDRGEHEVVFPLDKLSKGDKAKQLKTALSKDDIKNLEKWNSGGSAPGRDTQKGSSTASGAGGQPATSIPTR
jgi:hypothetical protein